MNEGTRSGKSTIRLLGISAERPTNGLYLLPFTCFINCQRTYTYISILLFQLVHVHACLYASSVF
jgi:hypothetical protein